MNQGFSVFIRTEIQRNLTLTEKIHGYVWIEKKYFHKSDGIFRRIIW